MKSIVLGALIALAGSVIAHEEEAHRIIIKDEEDQQVISNDEETQQPDPLEDFVCEDKYEISVYSRDPLVVYIKNFISPFEREHLQKVSSLTQFRNGTFARSNVASAGGDVVSSHRTSSSTVVGSDAVTNCIHRRAARFQGLDMPMSHLEPIQLVSYNVGEQYHHHHDWFPPESSGENQHAGVNRGGNRVSSFFTYVDVSDDIVGGGTHFPKISAIGGEGWCKVVECDDEWDNGVTFRAIPGNAVFWTNLVDTPDGKRKGDNRVLHAGLPVIKGSKLGMNIWTKEGNFN